MTLTHIPVMQGKVKWSVHCSQPGLPLADPFPCAGSLICHTILLPWYMLTSCHRGWDEREEQGFGWDWIEEPVASCDQAEPWPCSHNEGALLPWDSMALSLVSPMKACFTLVNPDFCCSSGLAKLSRHPFAYVKKRMLSLSRGAAYTTQSQRRWEKTQDNA